MCNSRATNLSAPAGQRKQFIRVKLALSHCKDLLRSRMKQLLTLLLALLPLLGAVTARAQEAGQVFIDTDFARADLPRQAQRSARVSGSLPAPWRDTSDWANVAVNHQRLEEDGRAFQRVAVSRLREGRAQIVHLLPEMGGGQLLSLRLTARGTPELPLTLGIRQQDAPYEYLWSRSVVLGPAWQDMAWVLPALKSAQPVMLILEVLAEGQLDIARAHLSATSPAELARGWKAQHPSPNLLRTSRLPLGPQSGWWFHQALWNWAADYGPRAPEGDSTQAQIAPDDATLSPSGAPSTHITAPRGFGLYSAPFAIPLPFEKHTASVHLKGRGRGSWIVWGDGRELARRDFDLKDGDGWQRQAATFTPDLGIQVYALRWEGIGEFWLDGLQVEAGEAATAFAPAMPAEVALSAASPGGAPYSVQWLEDRPLVTFAVLGASPEQPLPAGARLKARVENIYSEGKDLPDVPVGGKYLGRGQLDFGAFPRRPLGAFRVEAWVESANGERLSEVHEIVVNRLHKPRYWGKDAPNSPFGTHVSATGRDTALAKAIGVNWVRGHDIGMDYLGWFYLEPRPGEWKFRDAEIALYRRSGLKILGMLQTAPHWASLLDKPRNAYFDMFYQPKNPSDFGNYVRTVTQRYKGVIDAYEVWSEPWNHPWFAASFDESATGSNAGTPTAPAGYRTSREPQRDYARLMQEAYRNAKAVDPAITILGFNTTTAPRLEGAREGGDEWTRGVAQQGGLESCDVISYHHYMSEAEGGTSGLGIADEVERGYNFALKPLAAPDGAMPKPVWFSEGSPLTELSRQSGLYRHTLPYPAGEAVTSPSDRLCRFVVSILGQGARKMFLYSMHGGHFFGQPNEFGLLMHRDGSLHPTGVAYSQLTWQLEDTRFARRVALGPQGRGAWAYLFEGAGRSVAVLVPRVPGGEGSSTLPDAPIRLGQIEATDLWGNDVAAGSKLGATIVYASSRGSVDNLERMLLAGR